MAKTHRVKQGECLSSIAKKYSFTDWRTIYNHPQNAEFRRKRPNPNLIYPGDQIFIPDKDLKQELGGTEQRHKFRVKAQQTLLRIMLQDEQGQPLSGKRYKLSVQDRTYEDITGGDALIEHVIAADADRGELTVWPNEDPSSTGFIWTLKIGHLDPVEESTGVQARLNDLGFPCGPVDGICGPWTQAAVKAFQDKYGLTVDGIPGPQTQGKLKEIYGC
jgi:N-acetylmuramoyl-L-alanine amidase